MLGRLSWWCPVGIDGRRWPNRLLWLLKRMVELVGIDVFPYVSCFGDSFNDKEPELPVALSF
jgi:hypothetical protein